MMLDEINRRLQNRTNKVKGAALIKLKALWPEEGRTIGIKVPAEIREAIVALQRAEGLPSYKSAMKLACLRGLGLYVRGE